LKQKHQHPLEKIKQELEKENKSSGIQFCYAYYKDLEQAYAFYCSRYENISFNDFLQLDLNELTMKIQSIPETEPLYKVMKSRTINLSEIKDKEERKYWQKMKQANKIPDIYLPREYTKKTIKKNIGEIENWKKI
jgi:hypothetical protein